MEECELVLFISTVACTIAKCYNDDELALLGSIFSQLGDTLATIEARRDLCNNNDKTNDDV